MDVKQVYDLVNTTTQEVLGETIVTAEDLTNVVDIGTAILNANALDSYVRTLVNHIGKVIFVNRPYSGGAPSVLMDGWEYGSIMEKIQAELPEAVENPSWDLQDGKSYDPNIFHKPKVSARFFNSRVTFEIDQSFTERQVKQSFSNAAQLNGFLSMLYSNVEKAMTLKVDSLIMRTIGNMVGYVTSQRANNCCTVPLVTMYKAQFPSVDTVTAETALYNPAFIRYASYIMGVYMDRMSKMSTLFNIGNKERFTPADRLHVVMLSDFQKAAAAYLQSDTYHDIYVKLPHAETVPFWQGSGTSYGFSEISKIDVLNNSTESPGSTSMSGPVNYVIGVMFDRDALGVTNLDRRVTSQYNPKAEFWTNFYKFEAGYFNDLDENFVVFTLG